MTSKWQTVRLGDVITKRSDFTLVVADELYPVVGIQKSGWGFVRRDAVRGDSMKFSKLMKLEEGNLSYRVITAFEAPSAVVTSEIAGSFVTPQTFPVFKLDKKRILAGFMSLLTTSTAFHSEMASRCTGSVLRRKTLSVGSFAEIPISLPSISDQQRIVDLISSLDDAIEAADKSAVLARAATREYRRKILNPAFMGKTTELGNVSNSRLGKMLSTSTASDAPDFPYLRNANIQWNAIGTSDLKQMPFTEGDRSEFELLEGDVLICEGGEIGRSAVLEMDLPGVYFQKALHRVRCGETLLPMFLQLCMEQMADDGTLYLFSGASTIPHLTGEKLRRLPIPDMPLEEQRKFTDTAAALRLVAESLTDHADSLRKLRSELLTALLSGAHTIPESYDEVMTSTEELVSA